jgi:integrase
MVGTVKHARLESRTARSRLKRGRQPHWQALVPGRVHLGWQCWKGDKEGRWILRRYIGSAYKDGKISYSRYRATTIGKADDYAPADGERILSFEQAEAAARATVDIPASRIHRLTVRQAFEKYLEHKRALGQSISDSNSRGKVHILPVLGDLVVEELTAEVLRRWFAVMASMPAQSRPKKGMPRYKPEPVTDEDVRRRRATANRVLTILKAALNFAFDEGHVANRDAWGRKLKPFRDVQMARIRYLSIAEAQRLINSADPDFRPLVEAALQTGARYGELIRLEVADFNVDASTIAIRKSKTGKARHIVLTDEGAEFFQQICAGRAGDELMFRRADGNGWRRTDQTRPMREAVERAKITPRISFHGLRHIWASLAVMNGVPLMVVAKNLGHSSTAMAERHYSHLSPSFITDAIRVGAPRFGIKDDRKVKRLR